MQTTPRLIYGDDRKRGEIMGYRSDVVLRVNFRDKQIMDLFMTEMIASDRFDAVLKEVVDFPIHQGLYISTDKDVKAVEKNSYASGFFLRYVVESIKWYDSEDVVQQIEALKRLVTEYHEAWQHKIATEGVSPDEEGNNMQPIGYEWARVGEDMSDTELDSYGYNSYTVDIERKIAWR